MSNIITTPNGIEVELSLDNPLFEDFERLPATFEQFITDPYYLGNSWKSPWPFWMEQGKKMFPLPLKSPYTAVVLLGATGCGKALKNGTGVLTPTGYRPIETLKVGDLVASNDGKFYHVLGVFPQGIKSVYKFTFSTGVTCVASDNHIWTVSRDGKTFHDETTAEIVERGFVGVLLPKVLSPLGTELAQLTIENVEKDREAECTCISIDAPSHLYIVEGCIPTHNTSFAVNMVMAYFLHIILCLKDPHKFFALEPQKKVVFAFINIVTKTIAYKNAWGMFHTALLKSPFFMEYGVSTTGRRPEWVCTEKPVELLFGRNGSDVIGLDIICAFLDEVSFGQNRDVKRQLEIAKEVFDACLERIQSRFTKFGGIFDGLIIMASSKRTDQAFAEVYAKELISGRNGHKVFVVDKPRWEVLPEGTYSGETFPVAIGDKLRPSEIVKPGELDQFKRAGYRIIYPPIETYDEFSRDILSALTNIAGESVNSSGTFIAGEHIGACIDQSIQNPFRQSVIFCGTKEDTMFQDYCDLSKMTPDDRAAPWYIHIDASLGNDGNTISGGRILYAQDQRNKLTGLVQPELHYKQLFKIKVRAPKGDKVALRKNEQFIFWLVQQGIKIRKITSDQYQSAMMAQDFVAAGLNYGYQSIDRVTNGINKTYQVLRDVIYEHRIQILDDEDQTEELLHLVKYEDGRVDKNGQGSQDDASQCLCGWVYAASLDKDYFVQQNVVLEETVLGNSAVEQFVKGEEGLPEEMIFSSEMFRNEFGAYRTKRDSGVRSSYDREFSGSRKNSGDDDSSPLNFF